VNKRIDEEALGGIGGAVVFVVFGGEIGEIFGGFVEHDLLLSIDAVLEGVVAGCGLARGSARTCRGLLSSCHKNLDWSLAGVFGAEGRSRGLSASKEPRKGRKINLEVL
jgi:hypothetical protein